MNEDEAPPLPVPPASQAPYPTHPAPHPHGHAGDVHAARTADREAPTIGALGIGLIGGAVAAALGMLVAIPFLRRKPQAKAAVKKAVRATKAPAAKAAKTVKAKAATAAKTAADAVKAAAPAKPRTPRKPRGTVVTRRARAGKSDPK